MDNTIGQSQKTVSRDKGHQGCEDGEQLRDARKKSRALREGEGQITSRGHVKIASHLRHEECENLWVDYKTEGVDICCDRGVSLRGWTANFFWHKK